jgi:type IV pilus assembly protein PilO
MAMDLDDIDFSNIGGWPPAGKAILIGILCAAVAGLWFYFLTSDQIAKRDSLIGKEMTLKKEFSEKQGKAAALDAYKEQMKEMEESFGTMLRQLPSKTEVADLLVDITQTGLASGLNFELFQPNKELPKEFYAELPISIEVTGEYHDFGEFVSGIAALPRIVTLHDIVISENNNREARGSLAMTATAKTYRYLDDDEIAANRQKSNPRNRRRR